jgi:hypothetical protein
MPLAFRRAFLEAFSLFPDFEFIWRYTGGNETALKAVFEKHPNVHPFDWVDQPSILGIQKICLKLIFGLIEEIF